MNTSPKLRPLLVACRNMLKRLGVVAVLGVLTAGCGPNISGTVGVVVTASGEVLGISEGCGEKFGGATLYQDGPEID